MADINLSLGLDSTEAAKQIDRISALLERVLGQAGTVRLTADVTNVRAALDNVEKQAKEVAEKASGSFSEAFKGGLLGGALGGIASDLFSNAFSGVGDAISNAQAFEQGLAGLSAVTGVTGAGLDDLGTRARDLAKQFGGDANAQLASFQGILSKFGPALAGTPEQLGQISTNVNLLAKAGGLQADEAMSALADSMLQFGVNVSDADEAARESSRFINVLAASAQVGAAEIPQVAQAVLQAGVAAKGANVSFEETNAALQVLAVGGKTGSEAGVALRNVLGLLQKQSGEGQKTLSKLGLTVEGLGQTLTTKGLNAALIELRTGINKLGTDAEKNAALMQLFGTENASAAGLLLQGTDALATFTEGVTGTQAAIDQAATNMNTFGERIARLKANVQDGFIEAFQTIGPVISRLLDEVVPRFVNGFKNILSALGPTLGFIGTVLGGILGGAFITIAAIIEKVGEGLKRIQPIVPLLVAGIGAYAIATNAAAIATAFAAAKQAILNAVMAANPIGAVVLAVTAAVAVFGALADAMEVTQQEALDDAKAQEENLKIQIKQNVERRKSVASTQGLVAQFQELANKSNRTAAENEKLRKIQAELDKQYPDLIDQTKSFADNLAGVAEIGKRATGEMTALTAQGTQLANQLKETGKQIAALERNKVLEELSDSFGSVNFLGKNNENIFRKQLDNQVNAYRNALFAATNDPQIDAAQAKLLDFLNLEGKNLNDSDQLLKIINLTNEAAAKARAALKVYRGEQEKSNDEQNKQKQETEETTKAKVDLLKKAQEEFAIAKKTTEVELQRFRIGLLQQGLDEDQVKQQTKQKELELTQRLTEEFQKLYKAQLDTSGFVARVGFRVEQAELLDIRKEFDDLLLKELTLQIEAGIDPKKLEKSTKDTIKRITDLFKERKDELAEGALDPAAFREQGALLVGSLQQTLKALETQAASAEVKKNPKLFASLNEQIDLVKESIFTLNTDINNALAKADEATLKKQIELNKRRLELLAEDEKANVAEIIAIKQQQIDLETQLKLKQLKSTGDARNQETAIILREAAKQRKALEDAYGKAGDFFTEKINLSILRVTGSLADSITAAFETTTESNNEELDKQRTDLENNLKNRTIAYTAYVDGIREIDAQVVQEKSFLDKVLESSNAVIAESFKKTADAAMAKFNEMAASITDVSQLTGQQFGLLAAAIGGTFAGMVVSGKNSFKALLLAAIDALDALIPILVAQITGINLASLDNIATLGTSGLLRAAGFTALLKGLAAVARAAVQGSFAKGGAIPAHMRVIEVNEKGPEYVVPHGPAQRYHKVLEAMRTGKDPLTAFTRSDLERHLRLSKMGITFSANIERGAEAAKAVRDEKSEVVKELKAVRAQNAELVKKVEEVSEELRTLRKDTPRTTVVNNDVTIDERAIISGYERQQISYARKF